MHPLLNRYGWMVIPRGWVGGGPQSGELRISVRVFPQIPGRDYNTALQDYQSEAAVDWEALTSWPRYLDRTNVRISLQLGAAKGEVQVHEHWRKQVDDRIGFGVPLRSSPTPPEKLSADHDERIQRAGRLWQGIFPLATPVRAETTANANAAPVKPRSVANPWQHWNTARVMRKTFGELYSNGLDKAFAQLTQAPAPEGASGGRDSTEVAVATALAAGLATSAVTHSRAASVIAAGAAAAMVSSSRASAQAAGPGSAQPVPFKGLPGVSQLPTAQHLPAALRGLQDALIPKTPLEAAPTPAPPVAPAPATSTTAPPHDRLLEINALVAARSADIRSINEPLSAAVGQTIAADATRAVPAATPSDNTVLPESILTKAHLTGSDRPPPTGSSYNASSNSKRPGTPADLLDREFHALMGALTFHPTLLLSLGLTIEATVKFASVPADAILDLAVTQVWLADEVLPQGALTLVKVDRESGGPRSDSFEGNLGIAGATVDLKDFGLSQTDVDGGLEKFQHGLTKVSAALAAGVAEADIQFNPGAQRTTGFSLLHKASAQYHRRRDAGAATGSNTLWAEDLLAGFRPDMRILDVATGDRPCPRAWVSTVGRRIDSARLSGQDIGGWFARLPQDEGMIAPVARVPRLNGQLDEDVIFAQEELVNFEPDGWSPIIPRPGTPPGFDQAESGASFKNGDFSITYKTGRARSQIRFGCGVRMGLRPVYCDGLGPVLADATSRYEAGGTSTVGDGTEYLPILRAEPLAPPDVHLARALDRDNYPGERGTRLLVATRTAGTQKDETVRYVVPPRRSLEMAVLSGIFDSEGPRPRFPASAFKGIKLDNNGGVPAVPASLMNRILGHDDKAQHETIFESDLFAGAPTIPYLPDPAARRVIIALTRESDAALLYIHSFEYYDAQHQWPNSRVLKVVLKRVAGELPPREFTASLVKDVLTVELPPAMDLQLALYHEASLEFLKSSMVPKYIADHLADFAARNLDPKLPQACARHAPDRDSLIQCLAGWDLAHRANLDHAIPAGERAAGVNLSTFWMLNPPKTLSLVHAVDRPVHAAYVSTATDPDVEAEGITALPRTLSKLENELRLERYSEGETQVHFAGDVYFHRPSTVRLDCRASWVDPVDDARKARPDTLTGGAMLWSRDAIQPFLKFPISIPATDANHNTVYRPDSRPQADIAVDNNLMRFGSPRDRLEREDNEDGLGPSPVYDFGDTKARRVTVQLLAHGRFSDDFIEKAQPVAGPSVDLIVPSTRAPQPPDVDYIIPLLHWKTGHGEVSSIREGGWFRIWLQRGWYSSGIDEQLALVCWPTTTFAPLKRAEVFSWRAPAPSVTTPPDPIEQIITRWGSDPLWYEDRALDTLPAWAFSNRNAGDPPLVDLRRQVDPTGKANYDPQETRATVALYNPKFDSLRGRWHVDIHIDPAGSYFPFLRLALARYQPHALAGLELSQIAATEFTQLLPTRSASVTVLHEAGGRVTVTLTVAGTRLKPDDAHKSDSRANETWFVVTLEERETRLFTSNDQTQNAFVGNAPDSRTGDWLPAPEMDGVRMEGAADVQQARIPFHPESGRQYSLFIEEREPTLTAPESKVGRLVYSDRLIFTV
jgi:hypothetical protein